MKKPSFIFEARLFMKQQPPKIRRLLCFCYQTLLVGNVGKKCHLASSLDSCGKLSLVKSAGAGNTSGEYFCALGNELSELCYVFVIDIVYLILTEDANLLSSVHGAVSGTLCVIPFHLNRPFTFPTRFFYIFTRRSESCEGRRNSYKPYQKGRVSSLGISSKLAPPALLNDGVP